MNHYGKKAILIVFGIAFLPLWAAGQNSQSIYKHIDPQGRITYSNAPIAGGARVELEPITLIPATPSGSLVAPGVAPAPSSVPPPTAPSTAAGESAAAATMPTLPLTSIVPMPVAIVRPVAVSVKRAPPANAQPPLAMNILIQQRRDEIKLRTMQNAVATELKLLADARAKLAEENGASAGVRAMKASFHAAAKAGKSDRLAPVPVITPEERLKVERHFERVRDLQDQISMHEKNLDDLRAVLKVETNAANMVRLAAATAH